MIGDPILTAAEMRGAEQALFDAGMNAYALMERAGAAAAEIIWRAGHKRDALILCGPGNNGGDGFVIARLLRYRGVAVRVAATGESSAASAQKARALWDGPVEDIASVAPASQLVDALFGTGLSRGLDPALAAHLDRLTGAAGYSYAIDLPSGVETDSGVLLSNVSRFDVTIALGALKPAHLLQPAAAHCGRIIMADIGIPVSRAKAFRLAAPHLEAPAVDAYKYKRGLVAVLGGAMPGATALAAVSAAHGGAGYVRLVTDRLLAQLPHAIVQTSGDVARDFADDRIACVLVGPGLGYNDLARARMNAALGAGHAAVVDADGLMLLAKAGFSALPAKTILTPHEGEFRALFGEVPGHRIDRARSAARRANAVVILKGPDTVIAAPDGQVAASPAASSWLSTAGTGDVLAGLCAARLAVTGDPFRAACEAVWLHGDAARRAGAAFVADDLLGRLPAAIASRL